MADPRLILSPADLARAEAEQFLSSQSSGAGYSPAPAPAAASSGDPRAAARAEAASYLSSQGVPGYSAGPAPAVSTMDGGQSPAPMGPPSPPAPEKPGIGSAVWSGLKQSAVDGLGFAVGGPVGSIVAHNISSSQPAPRQEEPNKPEPGAKKEALTLQQDQPIILGRPGGGAGRMVSPAGMYPHSATTQAHMGRAVPEEAKRAFGAATEMQLAGADQQASADRDYYNHTREAAAAKMRATEDAATEHARVQAERDEMVRQRLEEIESFNAEAGAQIDPDKYWNDRGALARVIGAIATGLGEVGSKMRGGPNTTANIIEAGINREIQAQLSNRQVAGQKAQRAERLLDLHLDRLGSKDKAIDATKLALYDNVLGQMDQYAAENKMRVSEANLLNVKAGILEKRGELYNKMSLQETDDINKQYTEQYRPAQFAGGGGGSKYEGPQHIITIPASDGTKEKATRVAVDASVFKELTSLQGNVNALVAMNKQALQLRTELREALSPEQTKKHGHLGSAERIATLRKQLRGLNDDRAQLAEKAKDPNSAVREPEFERALAGGVDYTAGLLGHNSTVSGDVEKLIEGNSNMAERVADAKIRGVTGQVVRHAIDRDANGIIQNKWLPTGELYEGRAIAPEKK
jgi:hypothetical protein